MPGPWYDGHLAIGYCQSHQGSGSGLSKLKFLLFGDEIPLPIPNP